MNETINSVGQGNGNGLPLSGPAADAAHLKVLGEERQQASEIYALSSALLQRFQIAQQAGLTFGGQRDLYKIFGYPRAITTRQYQEEYRRGGISGRLIDVYPNATWRGKVTVSEDDDPKEKTLFEVEWSKLARRLQIQAKFLRGDKLSLICGFSVLLLGAEGDLSTELPRVTPGTDSQKKLIFVSAFSGSANIGARTNISSIGVQAPVYDSDVSIYELDKDPRSPRFGLPISYFIRRSDMATEPLKPVHWTRVIHIADGLLFDEVFGLPALERVWNLLTDLAKVTGGGAEAFWLRANQGLHLDIAKDMKLEDAEAARQSLQDKADLYKHQIERWLATRGVSVTPLGSDVANFSGPADTIITQIAGARGIPKRILTGSEMGELASSQDRDNWKDQIDGRQEQYAGPYIARPFIDRLVAYGYLPSPSKGPDEYNVVWPHVQIMTEDERAKGAQSWAATNQTQGEIVFTNDEIRDHWYGKAPLSPEEKKPIAAPVRESTNLPSQDAPDTENPDLLKTAEAHSAELERILEEAIECGNTEVIDTILGLSR